MRPLNLLSNGVIDQNPFAWVLGTEEIELVKDIAGGFTGGWWQGPGEVEISRKRAEELQKEDPDKYNKFIKVVCKVNNEQYSQVKIRKGNTKVTMKEIKRTFEEVINIKVRVINAKKS